jgi:transposase
MNELTLFTMALGLAKPWQVVEIKFSKEEGRLDLRIDFPKGAKFACPSCQEASCEVHDTQERTWRHLNFFQYETLLHARVPRVDCGRCGVHQVEVPWARPGSGFTLLFEMLVLQLSREMSVAGVAEVTSEHANRIWRILSHYVEKARLAVDLSGFRKLGIDEFSLRKGHVYMTSFSDLEGARVIFLGEGRKKGVIREFVEDLRKREISPSRIDVVCCDIWATHSRLLPVINAAQTIKRYWHGVVRYHNERITNGVVEGLNLKIKTAIKEPTDLNTLAISEPLHIS